MNCFHYIKKIPIFLLSLFLLSPTMNEAMASESKVLRVGYTNTYGVTYSETEASYSGYFVDYLNKILEYTKDDYTIQWVTAEWDLLYELLRTGEIDFVVPSRFTDELAEDFIFTQHDLGSNMLVLMAEESNSVIFNDFSKINYSVLALREGYQYQNVVDDFLNSNNLTPEVVFVPHDGYEDGVFQGKYDFCIGNSLHITSGFEVVAILDSEPIFLLGNTEIKEVFDDFDHAMEEMALGELFFTEKLYIQYFDHLINTDSILTREDYELLRMQSEYTIGYSPHYSPLTYKDENGEIVGISVEMMNKISEEVGIHFNWIDVTQLEAEELDIIDISLMAPNYADGKFAHNQSDPYFYYSYVLVENYDYVGKSENLGILNFYEIESRTLDAVRKDGEIIEFPNFSAMETAFFAEEIGSMIVTNTVYNKMRSEVKNAEYMVTPIDAKLDVVMAFSDDFPQSKVDIFNKLIAKLDSLELEYLFSEHMTVVVAAEEETTSLSTADIIREYWEVVGASFVTGSMTILFFVAMWSQKQRKKLKDAVATDTAIISCAKTLLDGQDEEALELLLKIICDFYQGEFAYIYERNPNNESIPAMTYVYANESISEKKNYFLPTSKTSGPKWKEVLEGDTHLFLQCDDKNLSDYAPCDEFLSNITNKNLLVIPLRIHGEMVGVLGVNNLTQNIKKFQLVNTVSAFISNNLEIMYTEKAMKDSVDNLEKKNLENQVIFDCVTTLVRDANLNESVYKLLEILCDYFQADRAYILQREESELVLFNEYLPKGMKPSVANFHHISFQVLLRWYRELHKNHTMWIRNALEEIPDKERNTKEYSLFSPEESFLATPLFENDEITGFLWVDNPKANMRENNLLKTISTFIVNHRMKEALHEQMREMSYSDSLTGLYNRNYYMQHMGKKYHNFGIIFADVNGLKKANDKLGHEYGDLLLKWCAKFFTTFTQGGVVFRIGGDEFVCFMEDTPEHEFQYMVDNLLEKMAEYGEVHISLGSIWAETVTNVEKQVEEADKRMYIAKQEYYAAKKLDPRSEDEQLESFRRALDTLEKDLNLNLLG